MGLSTDGLRICIGIETGAIGVLDIATHRHATLLRSHTNTINCVSISPVNASEFCTASSDGSVRIWSLPSCIQLFQFDAAGEKAMSVAYIPKGGIIAAGFNCGKLRVFDAVGTVLLQVCYLCYFQHCSFYTIMPTSSLLSGMCPASGRCNMGSILFCERLFIHYGHRREHLPV